MSSVILHVSIYVIIWIFVNIYPPTGFELIVHSLVYDWFFDVH